LTGKFDEILKDALDITQGFLNRLDSAFQSLKEECDKIKKLYNDKKFHRFVDRVLEHAEKERNSIRNYFIEQMKPHLAVVEETGVTIAA